jgi:ABC-type transport system involved in cytochrome c biogenesis permease subunit
VWALITLLACSLAFHTRSLPFMAKPKFFHIYCIAVFIIILFTYLGVNYLLGGIHSYA